MFWELVGVQIRFGKLIWNGSLSVLFLLITLTRIDFSNSILSKHTGTEVFFSNTAPRQVSATGLSRCSPAPQCAGAVSGSKGIGWQTLCLGGNSSLTLCFSCLPHSHTESTASPRSQTPLGTVYFIQTVHSRINVCNSLMPQTWPFPLL